MTAAHFYIMRTSFLSPHVCNYAMYKASIVVYRVL